MRRSGADDFIFVPDLRRPALLAYSTFQPELAEKWTLEREVVEAGVTLRLAVFVEAAYTTLNRYGVAYSINHECPFWSKGYEVDFLPAAV